MSRLTVEMPDEITILSMDTVQLHALSLECEIQQGIAVPPPVGYSQSGTKYVPPIVDDELRKMLVTTRALFDGRQFSITKTDLLRLQKVILPNAYIPNNVSTSQLALACAHYFIDGSYNAVNFTFPLLKPRYKAAAKTPGRPLLKKQVFLRANSPPRLSMKKAALRFVLTSQKLVTNTLGGVVPIGALQAVSALAPNSGINYYAVEIFGTVNTDAKHQLGIKQSKTFQRSDGSSYRIYDVSD